MANTKKNVSKDNNSKPKQDLLYIMSNTCGWCKKSDPVVAELKDEGADITTLDVMNPEDQTRVNEIKQKYNAQCGTPFFIDAETGNSVCGFREKDVLQKWVNGEEIPKPPQPKSPPPPPPSPEMIDDEKSVADWKVGYEKWAKENKHLPKIMPFDQIHQRVKQSYEMRAKQGEGAPQGGQPTGAVQPAPTGTPTGVKTTGDVIVDNRLQILESKQNILEAKLDQILAAVQNKPTVTTKPAAAQVATPPQPKAVEVDAQVKKQLNDMKANKTKTANRSKSNKKEIANF